MTTTALVVGMGSIGRRHARVLGELGLDVAVVSRHGAEGHRTYPSLDRGLAKAHPGYVIVANETAAHSATLSNLIEAGFPGLVLVEKPLFERPLPLADHGFAALFVGYNLRFHPLLQEIARLVAGERVISAHVYVGQYLPEWRPDRDYRQTSSASRTAGGGVLRDLSHELDYLIWLFGSCRRLAALGGRFGELDINSDDVQGLLLAFERCPIVTAQLNYLDRQGARTLTLNTARTTIAADFRSGTLKIGGEEKRFDGSGDVTYLAQHRRALSNCHDGLCTAVEGAAVVELIAAAETAATTGHWVTL
jgi:predicted dehydrogenase